MWHPTSVTVRFTTTMNMGGAYVRHTKSIIKSTVTFKLKLTEIDALNISYITGAKVNLTAGDVKKYRTDS